MKCDSTKLSGAAGRRRINGGQWATNLDACNDVTFAGGLDIRPGAARQAAHKLGLEVGYTGENLERALDELRPDFLVDVTVPEVHHDITQRRSHL